MSNRNCYPGFLAVVAIPNYIDLTTEAQIAATIGVGASLKENFVTRYLNFCMIAVTVKLLLRLPALLTEPTPIFQIIIK